MLDHDSSFFVDFLNTELIGNKGNTYTGVIETDLLGLLQKEICRELSRPLTALLKTQSICFCKPNAPMFYPVSMGDFNDAEHNQSTVNVQHLHLRNSFFAKSISLLKSYTMHELTFSLYFTREGNEGFSWHIDEWDNLSIQLFGSKTFETQTENKINTIYLNEGNWIKITPKESHRAVSTDFSIHLSVAHHINALR